MLKTFLKRWRGFTLTELLIALSLNGFLFVSLGAVFVSGLTHYNTTFQKNQLNTELHAALEVMAADLRRAGYWSNASSMIGTDTNSNPFMATGTDLSIGSGNTCVLLTYDHTNSGSLPAVSASYDDLRYGYRLSGNAIQSRPSGAPFDCTTATANWTDITDNTIVTISNLNFALNTQVLTVSGHTLSIRAITITLTGTLVNNSAITATLVETIRIANDKFT